MPTQTYKTGDVYCTEEQFNELKRLNKLIPGTVYHTPTIVYTIDSVPTKDSQNPVTSGGVYEKISDVEQDVAKNTSDIADIKINKQDKLTIDVSLSPTSTNPVQNKVINNAIQQLSQVLNTKPTEFFVSVNDKFSNGTLGAQWYDYDGNDITSQIGTGNYVDSNCRNNLFNSQETSVSILPYYGREYIIVREPVVNTSIEIDIKYVVITASQLMNIENKVIRIVEQEIPDRTGQKGPVYYEVKGALNDYSRYSEVKQGGYWTSITNKEPFTNSNVLPLGNLLTIDEMNNKKCFLTLINDQPLLFVKHGFQIQNIRAFGNVPAVDVLSIGIPAEEVTFTLKVEVIE